MERCSGSKSQQDQLMRKKSGRFQVKSALVSVLFFLTLGLVRVKRRGQTEYDDETSPQPYL
jgi:hypothetical protein